MGLRTAASLRGDIEQIIFRTSLYSRKEILELGQSWEQLGDLKMGLFSSAKCYRK